MPKVSEKKSTVIGVKMPMTLRNLVVKEAIAQGTTMAQVIRRIVLHHFHQQKGTPK